MKPTFAILFLLPISFFLFVSCTSEDESVIENYPITLSFKGEESSTLEYWKGGVLIENLTNVPTETLYDYFSGFKLSENDPKEKDLENKSLVIQFLDNNNLKVSTSDQKSNQFKYEFKSDTLKVTSDDGQFFLGIGNRNEIKVFYNISQFKMINESILTYRTFSGLSQKINFKDEFPINNEYKNDMLFKSPLEMGTEDEATFFNKEYIFRK